jgi:hypothetical protein
VTVAILLAPLALLLGSVAGLVIGRKTGLIAFAVALPAAGALAGLGAAGYLAGVQLHRVVADQYA